MLFRGLSGCGGFAAGRGLCVCRTTCNVFAPFVCIAPLSPHAETNRGHDGERKSQRDFEPGRAFVLNWDDSPAARYLIFLLGGSLFTTAGKWFVAGLMLSSMFGSCLESRFPIYQILHRGRRAFSSIDSSGLTAYVQPVRYRQARRAIVHSGERFNVEVRLTNAGAPLGVRVAGGVL